MKTAFAVLVLVAWSQSAKLPSNFKKCNRKEANLEKCVFEAAQDAVPQLTKEFPHVNLASFDPLEINELKIGAGSEGVVNVAQNFKNCKVYGISKMKLDDFTFDFEKKVLHGGGLIEEIKKVCDYELNGKVLLLPIVGNGQSTILIKKVKLTATLDYEEVKKKGKTYFHFTTQKLTLEPESVNFDLQNLFNGDKQLGDNINKVLNDNNKEVFADVKKGYEEGLGLVMQQIFNNFFSKVSIEEAFD